MFIEEIFIVKTAGTDDAQVICDNTKFISIIETAIDIELFDSGIGKGMRGHGVVSGFIRIITAVKVHGFRIGFEMPGIPKENKEKGIGRNGIQVDMGNGYLTCSRKEQSQHYHHTFFHGRQCKFEPVKKSL